jgi:ubiquinone biosynthesis protein
LHIESGWVPKTTRVDELESAVRTVCEPIFNKPLAEISFAQVLLRLFDTARRFDMQVQPQLILLQKTLLNIEGLGRQLYPQLDLWKTAQPVLRAWMRERISPRTLLKRLRQQLPDVVQAAKLLPQIFQNVTREGAEGRFALTLHMQEIDALRAEIRRGHARRDGVLLGAMLWMGGATCLALFPWASLLGWSLMLAGTVIAIFKFVRAA